MKKIILLLAAVAVTFASCKKDPQVNESPVIVIDKEVTATTLLSLAQDFTIPVKANVNYTITITYVGDSKDWIEEVEATRALSSKDLKFHATKWDGAVPRTAIIKLSGSGTSFSFKVVQNPPIPTWKIESISGFTDEDIIDVASDKPYKDKDIQKLLDEFGQTFEIYIQTNVAFTASLDAPFNTWVSIKSGPGVNPVQIEVKSARTGDIFDYSENRKAVVHLGTADGTINQDIIFTQAARTPGVYVITSEDEAKPADTEDEKIDASVVGQQIKTEYENMLGTIKTVKIIGGGNINEYDIKAIHKYIPNLEVLDMGGVVMENSMPVLFGNTTSNSANKIIKKVIFPQGMVEIPANAFVNCAALEGIVLPSTIKYIKSAAFKGTSLKDELVIPSTLQELGVEAITNHELSNLVFEDVDQEYVKNTTDVRLAIEDKAIMAKVSLDKSAGGQLQQDLVIPAWVESIGFQALSGVAWIGTKQVKLVIGKNVKSIGYGAFAYGAQFTELEFVTPGEKITFGSHTSFGTAYGTFSCFSVPQMAWPIHARVDDAQLKTVPTSIFAGITATTVTLPSDLTDIPGGLFGGSLTVRAKVGSVNIPTTVKTIGTSAFAYMDEINNSVLDLSGCTQLTTIGNNAFQAINCTEVRLPSSVTSLGSSVFAGYSLLTNSASPGMETIDLSNIAATAIPASAFQDNKTVRTVKLSGNITSIGNNAFKSAVKEDVKVKVLLPMKYKPESGSTPKDITLGTGVATDATYEYYE